MHEVIPASLGIVVDIVREHRPDVPRVFVGNGDQHLADRQAAGQCADPFSSSGVLRLSPFEVRIRHI